VKPRQISHIFSTISGDIILPRLWAHELYRTGKLEVQLFMSFLHFHKVASLGVISVFRDCRCDSRS
jgi:hypothetical protein